MDKRLLRVAAAICALLIAVLACGFSASTANIQSATLAQDPDGAEPTTVFAPTDTFYLSVELANASDATKVKASWTAVDVVGEEPDKFIDETELTSGSGTLTFNLSNDSEWPAGQYKVDLYLNEKLDRTLSFSVE